MMRSWGRLTPGIIAGCLPINSYVKQETSRKSPETTCNLPVLRSNTILFMTSDLYILTFDLDPDILSAYRLNFLAKSRLKH